MASVVLLGPLMSSLDSTVVNVSLARLAHDLQAPLARIQWVTTGYLLALALMLPLSGWLVDRLGAKRVYLGCFIAFTAASVLCGLTTSAEGLITCRVLQGMAGGLLAPMAQMMIARGAGRHMAKVMGLMIAPVLLGPIFGPALAGAILQHAGWQWIFFINVPIGVFATFMALWLLPAEAPAREPRPFDLTGFLLLSPGLVLLLHSMEHFGSSSRMPLRDPLEGALALLLLAGFAAHARRRGSEALVDFRLLRTGNFLVSSATQFLVNGVAYGGQLLIPLFLILERGATPMQAGMLLAPAGVGMLFSFPSAGMLTARFGARRVSATGAAIALLGTLPFALGPWRALAPWILSAALFVRGAGLGAISLPSLAAAYAGIAPERIPSATTVINIVQRLGGPLATMALALVLNAGTPHLAGARPDPASFALAFWLLCGLHGATMLSALRLPLELDHSGGNVTPPAAGPTPSPCPPRTRP
jgi:EmrB/QacA subfamily drug resistance transporter